MYSLKKYIYLIFLFHCFYKNIGHKWHAEYWNSWQNNTVLVLHIKVSDSKVFWYNRNLIRHFDSDSKRSACNAGDPCLILGLEDPLEEGMATHSSIHAWRIPMDRGTWWATVHGGHKESDTTDQLTLFSLWAEYFLKIYIQQWDLESYFGQTFLYCISCSRLEAQLHQSKKFKKKKKEERKKESRHKLPCT